VNNRDLQAHLTRFSERAVDWLLTSGVAIVVVLVLTYVAARLYRLTIKRIRAAIEQKALDNGDHRALEELLKRTATLSGILDKAGAVTIWMVGGTIVLKQSGIAVMPILAGVGIIGLAVGFGAQSLVRDVISGFFIILEDQIRLGDVAAINGTTGHVEEINLRTIVLRDLSGTVHHFPNGTITTVANMTKDWSAMVFNIGVAYKEDTDNVARIMVDVAEQMCADGEFKEMILEPLELLGVDAFEDSAVIIKARLKTRPMQQWSVGREYRRRLKKALDEKKIEIPFPHRTIYWGGASDAFRVSLQQPPEGEPTQDGK